MRPFPPACFLIFFAFHLTALTGHGEEDFDLRQVLDRHLEAVGGMRAWSTVESIQINGTIERGDQLVDLVIVKKQPNHIRATITLPLPGDTENKLQVIRAHDGKEAWTATRLAGAENMNKEALSPEAASELLLDGGVMPPLLKMWRESVPLELREPRRIGYETAHTIGATPEDGPYFDFFVSSEDFRLIGYESTNRKGQITKTFFEDYAQVEGVLLPRRVTIDSEATGKSVIRYSSFEIGVGIYNDYFEIGDRPKTARQP